MNEPATNPFQLDGLLHRKICVHCRNIAIVFQKKTCM